LYRRSTYTDIGNAIDKGKTHNKRILKTISIEFSIDMTLK
jgi:hypothetical protein